MKFSSSFILSMAALTILAEYAAAINKTPIALTIGVFQLSAPLYLIKASAPLRR